MVATDPRNRPPADIELNETHHKHRQAMVFGSHWRWWWRTPGLDVGWIRGGIPGRKRRDHLEVIGAIVEIERNRMGT